MGRGAKYREARGGGRPRCTRRAGEGSTADWGQKSRGAHPEHVLHVRDARGIPAGNAGGRFQLARRSRSPSGRLAETSADLGSRANVPRSPSQTSADLGMARRSRYSMLPVKFECKCSLTQNAFWGSETARHLGPTPRGRLKFGRMLACWTRTARNRRVEGARRSVTGPLSAAFARDALCGLAILTLRRQNRDFSNWRHRTAPKLEF